MAELAEKQQYDKTYMIGNTKVNIVAPKGVTKEEAEKIWKNVCRIASEAICSKE